MRSSCGRSSARSVAAGMVTMLAASARVVAHAAAYYGYDLRRPEERVFALALLTVVFAPVGPEVAPDR